MSETAVLPRSANLVETNRRVLVAGIGFASFEPAAGETSAFAAACISSVAQCAESV